MNLQRNAARLCY